ncbi:MAG TPA: tripartite tricarboxylate transporter TctB family protein [Rubrobacteraceae bacterium]|jgi:putative tricarboxylic transport membrane protein
MSQKAVSGRTDELRAQEAIKKERRPVSRSLLLSVLPEVVLLAATMYLFVVALGFKQVGPSDQIGPGFWPQMLCVGIGIGALVRLGQKLRSPESRVVGDAASEAGELRMPRVALGVALVVGYVVGMLFLGYILATALFLIAFIYLGGQRQWYVVPLGIASSLLFAYVFLKVVYIALPSGVGIFDQLTVLLYELLGVY